MAVPAPRPASEPLRPAPLVRRVPLLTRARILRLPARNGAYGLRYSLHICSMRCMAELTVRQAREMLTAWAAEQDAVTGRRDEVVRAAVAAGLSKSEIHRLTGIARTTIDRIVGAGHGQAAEEGAR
jgi:hypothetical protein